VYYNLFSQADLMLILSLLLDTFNGIGDGYNTAEHFWNFPLICSMFDIIIQKCFIVQQLYVQFYILNTSRST